MAGSRPKGCENCTKQCTIHLTQIIGNQIMKIDMCEECPHAEKLQNPNESGLIEKLIGMAHEPQNIPALTGTTCPSCGMSEADFKKRGRLGCAHCYDTFAPQLQQILPTMHKGTSHVGKHPKNQKRFALEKTIRSLEAELASSVKAENFELAAELRDKITELKGELESLVPVGKGTDA